MADIVYLVGVDGSEWSDRAAERAVGLAKKTGAEVHFITAVQWSKYQPLYVADFSAPPQDTSEQEKWERKETLEPLLERYKNSAVPIKAKIFWGHPADIIKEQAKKIPANMIFVGRKGRSKVADVFLGSVANSLAHSAGVPIVLVP